MFTIKENVSCLLIQYRRLSLSNISRKNHYDTLGITPNATVNEIKKAYYNLSMLYHPDKSNGSVEALEKFRNVTEAYEVLGNLATKRLYDKGVLQRTKVTANKPVAKKVTVIVPDLSKTPIYNFELWSRGHYSETIERRATAKKDFQDQQRHKENAAFEEKIVVLTLSLVGLLGSAYVINILNNPGIDIPIKKSSD